MRMYIGQGVLPTICHWVAALGRPGRASTLLGAARTFSEAANKATGFRGINSDYAQHDKQGGLAVGLISRDYLRALARSFDAGSRTTGSQINICEGRS